MSSLDTLSPPPSRENAMAVYRRLRKMILSGRFESGQALSQVQLAVDFATSRGPVREALRMLQREGLIEAEANQKGRIVSFTPADLEQVGALLVLNAAMAIRMGERRFTERDMAAAVRVIDRIEALAGEGGTRIAAHAAERRRLAFRRLITLLCRYAGPHARQLIADLMDRMAMFRQLHAMVSGAPPYPLASRLPQLREACERRDAAAMSAIVVDKIAEICRKALIYMADHYDPAVLDAYVRAALAATGCGGGEGASGVAGADAAALTIRIRGRPGSRVEYEVVESSDA